MDYVYYSRDSLTQSNMGVQVMTWVGLGLFMYGLCTLNIIWVFLGLALFIIFVGHGH